MKFYVSIFTLIFFSCEINKTTVSNSSNIYDSRTLKNRSNISLLNKIRTSPGIIIQGNDEENARVYTRGINSINFQKEVLFVLNGFQVGTFSQIVNILDPNDIKSIQVLKNGSDLAIYGFRGSGGVILIKTK
jgi:TonB-dependent SusC/RagA subfamily outer membrane receptor